MLNGFDVDLWKGDGTGEFYVCGEYAEIKKDKTPLGRLIYNEERDNSLDCFAFTVDYETDECGNEFSAYAIVSLYRRDGSAIKRFYADNESADGKEKKVCKFYAPSECVRIGVELGLKGRGEVRFYNPCICAAKPNKERKVRIASTRLEAAGTTEQALKNIENVVDKAGRRGTDIILMSEVINDFGCGLPISETAETLDGRYCTLMRQKAVKYNTYIVMNFHEKDEEGFYNTSLLIDRQGNIAGKYRKTHISFSEWEKGVVQGDELPVFDTDFGRVGMLICWDMYFPEPARILTLKGAELILVSTVGDPAFRHVSRAMENGVYVAVSGSQYHNLNDCKIKPSKIIAPDGEILAQTDEIGEAAIAEIDLNDKKQIYWLSIPAAYSEPNNVYMSERRPELYKNIFKS